MEYMIVQIQKPPIVAYFIKVQSISRLAYFATLQALLITCMGFDYSYMMYCQHFQYLKINESIFQDKQATCNYCFQGVNNLWICLSRGCGIYVCAKNNDQHLYSHLQESRKNKKFHSIFINCFTAEIRCVHCSIQICDLDIPANSAIKNKQDPFPYRLKLLPGLTELTSHKITGQLQNSQGHRKISRGLVGIFSNKYNHAINTCIQFIAHCKFIKEVILSLKISQRNKMLMAVQEMVRSIQGAEYRAIHSNTLSEYFYKEMPYLLGYKRKDPFELILYLFNLINDETLFYSPSPLQDQHLDEWDVFYKKNMLNSHYMVYNAIQSTLSLNYYCNKCQVSSSVPHNIQFLKVNIPKKKRKTKEIEKELANHRYSSPVKTKSRRKSLINLFKEEECPLTIPQLIIELMKSPLHKEMTCQKCSEPLNKTKLHFQKLPDILMIQVARMGKDKHQVDDTEIQLSTESLDLGSFTSNPDQQIMYDFESAVCIQKKCLFPIVVISQSNKQKYVIRHQIVELCKEKMNPYILCYRKRPTETAKQKLAMIHDDLKSSREKGYFLPDFWMIQLENGIETRPFRNQLICKHNAIKPLVQSKMINTIKVSGDVYQDLAHFYNKQSIDSLQSKRSSRKRSSSSPRMQQKQLVYLDEVCAMCEQQIQMLSVRRKKQKDLVMSYDRLRAEGMPYCMISSQWIKKWSNYLYNNDKFAYMPKGYALPPPIDNKSLLDGNKCKANLVKNQDFKILNIYLWKFLKELYGGGPQIRYKWKESKEHLDEHMITDIKEQVLDLKYIYSTAAFAESPKKNMVSLSFIERSMSQSFSESFSQPHFEIQEGKS